MTEPLWQPRTDTSARLLGAGFLVAGLLGLRWQIIGTLREAEAGMPQLSYSMTLILLSVFAVALGGLWVGRGLGGYQWVRRTQHEPRARRIFFIFTLLLGVTAWVSMHLLLGRLGYTET